MYKLAVLGDRASVIGYRTLGFEICAVENEGEGKKELARLAQGEYAVIYITEQLACKMMDDIARYKDCAIPAIILIPGKEGSLGIGMRGIHDSVERAVGADILKKQ